MTPLQLFLIQIVLIILLYIMDTSHKKDDNIKNWIKSIGGFIIFSVFGTAIWAIIYYL